MKKYSGLSHISPDGDPKMVDVSGKAITRRLAKASCEVILGESIMNEIEDGDIRTKKGPVFQTAIIAAVMAAKKTSELIPFCHPLAINKCDVSIVKIDQMRVQIAAEVSVDGKTGVEMEALTACSVAALTIYDMCKAMSHDIKITDLSLISKKGGKRDFDRETP